LTGRPPFDGSTIYRIADSINTNAPRSLGSIRADVSPALEAAILRCLRTDPDERHRTVLDLARALEPFAAKRDREHIRAIAAISGSPPSSAPTEDSNLISALPLVTRATPEDAIAPPSSPTVVTCRDPPSSLEEAEVDDPSTLPAGADPAARDDVGGTEAMLAGGAPLELAVSYAAALERAHSADALYEDGTTADATGSTLLSSLPPTTLPMSGAQASRDEEPRRQRSFSRPAPPRDAAPGRGLIVLLVGLIVVAGGLVWAVSRTASSAEAPAERPAEVAGPAETMLRITSRQEDAFVRIDDGPPRPLPLEITAVRDGRDHTLVVEASGFQPRAKTVRFESDRMLVDVTLSLAPGEPPAP
jgi:hypothetical protein